MIQYGSPPALCTCTAISSIAEPSGSVHSTSHLTLLSVEHKRLGCSCAMLECGLICLVVHLALRRRICSKTRRSIRESYQSSSCFQRRNRDQVKVAKVTPRQYASRSRSSSRCCHPKRGGRAICNEIQNKGRARTEEGRAPRRT